MPSKQILRFARVPRAPLRMTCSESFSIKGDKNVGGCVLQQGLWPAFWMLGENITTVGWPTCGEMDIMENRGSQTDRMSSAVHGPGYSGNTPFVHVDAPVTTTDFHVYAVEWDHQSIRYFVDSTMHYEVLRTSVTQRGSWVFDQAFFTILNLAVGGNFDGDPQSNAIFPTTMLIDYVRVYTL